MRAGIVCALLLAGCAPQSSDGYQFDDMEFDRPTPNITVVTHPSLANLRAEAPAVAIEPGRNLYAWSYLTRDACEIHVVDPRVAYQPEWIGHETAHCIWGRWHP